MKKIVLNQLHIQNFKGCKDKVVNFGSKTFISGANEVGKTTIVDAFMWLLFNKNSLGEAKFKIRPEEDGKVVDNLEISVDAIISADGEEFSLKKVQKQKWVKKRGTNETKFQGNVNEYEINGYPKDEKEFKVFIGSLVDEKIFNLVTNPRSFIALPWKEQREILMQFVGQSSDIQIAELHGEKFAKLIPELKIASTDDILKKYNKAKATFNKQMVEIPARIDEASKQLVIVDVGALEVEKSAKLVELQKIQDELSGGNSKLDEINGSRQSIMELKLQLSEIQNKANEELEIKRGIVRANTNSAEDAYRIISKKIHDLTYERDNFIRQKETAERDKVKFLDEWKAAKNKVFREYIDIPALEDTAMICPTCGQDLPEDVKQQRIADYETRKESSRTQYQKEKEEFETSKAKSLSKIVELGQKAADDVRAYQKLSDDKQAEINSYESDLVNAKQLYTEVKAKLDKIPAIADVSNNVDYIKATQSIEALEETISELSKESSGKTELEAKKIIIQDEITDIDRKIAAADNTKVQERISELETEQRNVGQKIADQEQMIDLTEEFVRTKMKMISDIINEKFGGRVTFRLFENQINEGLKETCEVQWDGKPEPSNGDTIVAGLHIVKALSELYEVSCPVFVDNAEAVSDGRMPELDCQMIFLEVKSPMFVGKDGKPVDRKEPYNAEIHNMIYDGSLNIESEE